LRLLQLLLVQPAGEAFDELLSPPPAKFCLSTVL
jgi:hypothetical protein